MCEFLRTYRIAQGASIFVSNGEICIPFDDGEPQNLAQQILAIKEQKNTILAQMDIIKHSQKVLEFLMDDAEQRENSVKADLEEAKTKKGKEKYADTKDLEHQAKVAANAWKQLDDQHRQNEHEIMRFNINLKYFDEQIAELSK